MVLKGIEYDTNNAGHMLVVMPENVKLRILEMRGMPLPTQPLLLLTMDRPMSLTSATSMMNAIPGTWVLRSLRSTWKRIPADASR